MQHTHDRRVSGVRRVPVERIVDVCGASDPASAFQGRSVDVSGRGMQVRAAHLPELRAPIVVRFQEQGSDVIAEGEVAWRRACATGGEFGVRFTALDSRSVQALKALCGGAGLEDLQASPEPSTSRSWQQEPLRPEIDHDTDPAPPAALGVRLHIAGLTAPLHAHIKGQGARSLEVGSQLEFLRVGRQLEIEDLAYGGRRPAFVESVEVNVDQKSRVPELLVSVRYSENGELVRGAPRTRSAEPQRATGASVRVPMPDSQRARPAESQRPGTPEPQRARTAEPARVRTPQPQPTRPLEAQRSASPEPARSPAALDRETPSRALPSTSPRAPNVRTREPELDLSTARELTDDEPEDDERDSTPPPLPMRADRAEPPSSRKPEREGTTRPKERDPEDDPEGAVADSAEALLRQLEGLLGGASSAARAAGQRAVLLGSAASRGAGWLFAHARQALHAPRRPAQPRRRTAAAPRSASLRSSPLRQNPPLSQRPRSEEASAAPRPSGARVVLWSSLIAVVAVSIGYLARRTPLPAAPPAARVAAAPAPAAPPALSAESPRAAAPAPAAETISAIPPAPAGASSRSSSPASANDDSGSADSNEPSPRSSNDTLPGSGRGTGGASSDEFGQGRLQLPVIYRLRLDDVGGALRGERTATGFEITIPGRRVLDSGASIARRDARIAKVTTQNSAQGTRVSFRFRETIPAYKVRIRKDVVEFWISSN